MASERRPNPRQERPSDRLESDREQALFEAGIKLGGIFHQFIGVPVSKKTAGTLERAIEAAVGLQPFITKVSVAVRPPPTHGSGRFAYHYLTADMLHASITVQVGGATVTATLSFRQDLNYPLMKVDRIVSD
jgi:hypothetical protein